MHPARRRVAWRYVVAVSAALTFAVLVPFSAVANATTKANVAAFCRAETYVARYDTNGSQLFGNKGSPLSWTSTTQERLGLTTLDQEQADAAADAPTSQLAAYSKQLSQQFVPWLKDAAMVDYYVTHKVAPKPTPLEQDADAAYTQAAFIMESRSFTDPVEHYCPSLEPPKKGVTETVPHLENYPIYDTTPVAVEVAAFITEVSFRDQLNASQDAIANPSLSHLRTSLKKDDTGSVRATFVGTPKSFGRAKSKLGKYYWDIHYRVSLDGQFFSVHIHLFRITDGDQSTLAAELTAVPDVVLGFSPAT